MSTTLVEIQPRRNCPILDPFFRQGDLCSKAKLEDSDLDLLGIPHDRHDISNRDFQEMSEMWLG